WLHRSLALLDKVDDPLVEVALVGSATAILIASGDPAWQALADRVRGLTGEVPQQLWEVHAHMAIGWEAVHAAQLATASRLLSAGSRSPALRENSKMRLLVQTALALLDYYRGEWDGLAGRVAALLDEGSEMLLSQAEAEMVAGCLALAHGDAAQAVTMLT